MTRQEFIEKFRHQWDGIVLDACITHRTGAELSMWLRQMRGRIELGLGEMHDALVTPPEPKPNGQHKPVAR